MLNSRKKWYSYNVFFLKKGHSKSSFGHVEISLDDTSQKIFAESSTKILKLYVFLENVQKFSVDV